MKGFSAGISIRVGQAVGSGHPGDAKVAAKVGLTMAGKGGVGLTKTENMLNIT